MFLDKEILSQIRNEFGKFVQLFEEQNKLLVEQNLSLENQTKIIQDYSQNIENIYKSLQSQFKVLVFQTKSIGQLIKTLKSQNETLKMINDMWKSFHDRFKKVERMLFALSIFSEEKEKSIYKRVMREFLKSLDIDIKTYELKDEEGFVYDMPSNIVVDLIINEKKEHILIDFSLNVTKAEVVIFNRICQLYKKKMGYKPKMIIVSAFIDKEACQLAKNFEFLFFKDVEEVYEKIKEGEDERGN